MFIPIHARRVGRASKGPQAKPKPAFVAAALTAVVGVAVSGMVSDLLHAQAPARGPAAVAVGLVVGLGAAAAGILLARAIGRQGRL